jgi:hypothetical protein
MSHFHCSLIGRGTLFPSGRRKEMDATDTKQQLEHKLARCRELAEEFRNGPTAEMIRDMEDELREQIRALERR